MTDGNEDDGPFDWLFREYGDQGAGARRNDQLIGNVPVQYEGLLTV